MAKPEKIKTKRGVSYRIFVNKTVDGKKVRESKSFSTRQMAVDWGEKRERELDYEAIHGKQSKDTIKAIIERYQSQFSHNYGRSKNYDIVRLMTYPIAALKINQLSIKAIIAHCIERNKTALPQTVQNDIIWLRTILRTMSATDGFSYDPSIFDKAGDVLRQQKLIAKSSERKRRPTKAELWKLSKYFYKRNSSIPMLQLMWFAIFSARRVSEITRLEWADNNTDRFTGMVRDAKHPTDKKGNDKRFKYTQSAWKIVVQQPKTSKFIFPYNSRTVSETFRRACIMLDIHDLHFHDLRRESVSRLIEQGLTIPQVCLFSLHESWKTLQIYTELKPEDYE